MGKFYATLLLLAALIIGNNNMYAQCANDNSIAAGSLTPPGVGQSSTLTYNSGQYILADVIAGANYTATTCGSSSYDTQITVYDNATGTVLAYNDDFCGLQSSTSFTPATCGQVRVLLDQYSCNNSNLGASVTFTQNTAGTPATPVFIGPDVVQCGGTVTLDAGPGTTYAWSNSDNTQTSTVSTTNTYSVTVTDANLCTATDDALVTINPAPSAVITPSSPNITCADPTPTLTGSGGTSYGWTTGSTSPTTNISQPGTYGVTVTDANTCTASTTITLGIDTVSPIASASSALSNLNCYNPSTVITATGGGNYSWSNGSNTSTTTVNSGGTYTVTVTATSNGCTASASASLTDDFVAPVASISPLSPSITCISPISFLTASGGGSYAWSTGDNTATVNTNLPGNYDVTVTDLGNGCSALASVNVVMDTAQPVIVLNPSPASINCNNSSVTITASGGDVYAWSNGDNTASTNVTSGGTYTVTVTTSGNGCLATAVSTVTVDSIQPFITISGNDSICEGNATTLTATGGASYNWSSGSVSDTAQLAPSSNTAYTVTATGNNGCTASFTQAITVNPIPLQPGAFQNSSSGVCLGQTGVNYLVPNQNGVSYNWTYSGTGAIINGSGNSVDIDFSNNATDGILSVNTFNSCGASTPLTIAITLSTSITPTVSITSTASTICEGTPVTYTGTITNGGSSPTYLWKINGVTAGTNSNTFTSTTLQNNDDVTLDLTSSAVCATPATLTSNNLSITVNALPATPVITRLVDTLYSSTTGAGYQWYLNNNQVAGGTSQSLLMQQSGNYTVEVTDVNGCSSTSALFNAQGVFITDITADGVISVFPNPSNGLVNISFGEIETAEISIKVSDLNGRLMIEVPRNTISANSIISADLTSLADGVYFIQIAANGKSVNKRIVLNR
jgi:predicted RNA-binding protein with TRAM domain